MTLNIVAIVIYAFLLLASLLALKTNLKQTMRNSKPKKTLEQQHQPTQVTVLNKLHVFYALLKSFTFFNAFCKDVLNRTQSLLFTYAAVSCFLLFGQFWYISSVFGVLFSIIILCFQWVRRKGNNTIKNLTELINQKTDKVQVTLNCIFGVIIVGTFLVVISLLYSSISEEIAKDLLIHFCLLVIIDSLLSKPLFFAFISLVACPLSLKESLFSQKALTTVASHKLHNQFYKTSQSEAKLNDSLAAHRILDFHLQEQGKEVVLEKEENVLKPFNRMPRNCTLKMRKNQLHRRKAKENAPQDELSDFTLVEKQKIAEKTFQKSENYESFPTTKQEIEEPKLFNQTIQKSRVPNAICFTDQNSSPTFQKRKPTFFKQRSPEENSTRSGIKRRRQNTRKRSYYDAQRLIEIYGDEKDKSSIDIRRKSMSIGRTSSNFKTYKSTHTGLRNKPIVHEQYDSNGSPKVVIKNLFNFAE